MYGMTRVSFFSRRESHRPLEFIVFPLSRLQQKARNRTAEAHQTHLQDVEDLITSDCRLATGGPVLIGKDSE